MTAARQIARSVGEEWLLEIATEEHKICDGEKCESYDIPTVDEARSPHHVNIEHNEMKRCVGAEENHQQVRHPPNNKSLSFKGKWFLSECTVERGKRDNGAKRRQETI